MNTFMKENFLQNPLMCECNVCNNKQNLTDNDYTIIERFKFLTTETLKCFIIKIFMSLTAKTQRSTINRHSLKLIS